MAQEDPFAARASSVRASGTPDGREPPATQVFLRPLANPFALGFVGVAGATIMAAGLELGWIPADQRHDTALLIIAFAPAILFLASVFGFLARDAIAATASGVMSATWLAVAIALLLSPPGSHSRALALLLFVAGTAILMSAAIAAQSKLVPAFVLSLTAIRFILAGIHEWGAGSVWGDAAGWAGVALCACALYAAISLELEDIKRRPVLPTLRRGTGRRALEPRLEEQVRHVAAEAGVRREL
jgi:succinate-acetate transporter protein